jgi:hypothetical protein
VARLYPAVEATRPEVIVANRSVRGAQATNARRDRRWHDYRFEPPESDQLVWVESSGKPEESETVRRYEN